MCKNNIRKVETKYLTETAVLTVMFKTQLYPIATD